MLMMTIYKMRPSPWHTYALPPTCPRGDRAMPHEVELPVGNENWYVEVQEWAYAELAPAGYDYAYEAVEWIEPDAMVVYAQGRAPADRTKARWRWCFDDLRAATLFKLRWVG